VPTELLAAYALALGCSVERLLRPVPSAYARAS
jgi:hypothetical protein